MRIRVEPPVWELFPELRIGVVVARGIDNTAAVEAAADRAREDLERAVAAAVALPIEDIPNHPAIAPWRAAYRAFGAKPNDHRPSLEGLLRATRRGSLGSINPLVDLYNAVSLAWLLPCGGEDLAAVAGDLVLTRAAGDEPFVPLGGGADLPPKPGEVVYRDDLGVVCRCLNWREAERTKLTAATRDAVLVLEALPPEGTARLESALGDLAARIAQLLGGSTTVAVLGRDHPEAPLGG